MNRTILLTIVLAVGTAHADAPYTPEVQRHVDAGLAAYRGGDYDTASREIEAAYKLDPRPALLYTWAQAKRQGNHCDEALPLYKRYGDTATSEAQTTAARTGIELCERQLAERKPKQPDPIVTPPPPPRRTESPRWRHDKLGGALAIAGLAGLGTGLGFLVAAKGSEDRARSAEFRDDFGRLLDQASSRRQIGAVALGVGGALLATGIVVYAARSGRTRIVVTDRSISLAGSR